MAGLRTATGPIHAAAPSVERPRVDPAIGQGQVGRHEERALFVVSDVLLLAGGGVAGCRGRRRPVLWIAGTVLGLVVLAGLDGRRDPAPAS